MINVIEQSYEVGQRVVVRGGPSVRGMGTVERVAVEPIYRQHTAPVVYVKMDVSGDVLRVVADSSDLRPFVAPEVGMGCTYSIGSDSYAATIIAVTHKGKKIAIQFDDDRLISGSIESESQTYEYVPNPRGEVKHATLRPDGAFREVGTNYTRVSIGARRSHRDPSF